MIAILITIIILLMCITAIMYFYTSQILKSVDKMLDNAISGTFTESDFSETKLSKLEAKMRRYLMTEKISRNRVIEERSSIKSLVSDISHQTKTPIANIMLYTELMGEHKQLDSNSKQLLKNIKEQSDKLNFLIQALVKASRLENGILSVEPHENNIRELFHRIDFADIAAEKGVDFEYNEIPDLTAVFDLKWTVEAVSNIIDNAIKYTPSGGTVSVSVKAYEMFVRIDISDTGIGISEEDTAKIFRRFYRSTEVHDERGVGIGLYLAREIISREKGYIKVISEKGKGSVFSVFLPNSNLSKL